MISTIIDKLKQYYYKSSSERYIAFLRSKGIDIGDGTMMRPKSTNIDISRPSLISIGEDCYMNENFTLLTHDWVTRVFIHTDREFLPSSGRVTIGNNVSFGQNVMVLKGVTIGDNCFVGAGSIVIKDIPSNSIAVGVPCKVVMSLEDYYQKRTKACEAEAMDYARSIQERFYRRPIASDFWEEFPLFVSGYEVDKYPELPIRRQLGPVYEKYIKNHKAHYASLEEFLSAAGCK